MQFLKRRNIVTRVMTRICLAAVCLVTVLQSMVMLVGVASAQEAMSPAATQEHAVLKNDVGTWDATMKIYSVPGEEPAVSEATETNELLPGGIWLLSNFEGEIMGMPFSGHGVTGYDPVEKKYVGTWVDSMSPNMMRMEAEYDPATKTMTGYGEGRDPASGEMIKNKQISRTIDDDTRTFEMLMPDGEGGYQKMMEVEYTRRK
jgi:hypothetical protein